MLNLDKLKVNRFLCVFFIGYLFLSCKKEKINYTYGVNHIHLLPSNVNKTRLKSSEQYISILYTNLFQKSLSSNQIATISQAFESVGDQILARQIFVANLLNKPGVIIPSVQEMNANLEKFIEDTYIRFYVRKPTQAEKEFMLQAIQADPNLTPELIYMAFALSNEYMYY
ncbi:MAG: hypothetical protein N3F09_09225 [Bacteroidia bacterium]|nr:hypothetical protein [Bacteroidia bacterium]